MKKFILFILICLFSFTFNPADANAIVIGNFDYGGKVVIKWLDAHNKLDMRPDEITIPLRTTVFLNGKDVEAQYEITLNSKDAKVTEDGPYSYWTFDVSFPYNSTNERLKFTFDTSADFNVPRSYIKGIDIFESGQLGCVTPNFCSNFEDNVLEISLVKDVSKDITVKTVFNDDNGRDNYRYIYFYMKGLNTVDTYYRFEDGTVKSKVDEYSYVKELIKYLVTDIGSSSELEKIEYEYGILDDVKDLTDSSYQYTVEGLDNGDIIYTINHKAERVKVPVKVNWLDDDNIYGKRPSELSINTINQYGEIEENVELTDENWDTELELFKNIKYSFGEEQIEYNLEVSNSEDYEYEVEKVDDGFVITANYIGEKIIPNDEEVNPQTYDGIKIYVLTMLVSISGIAISIKKLKKA